MSTTRDIIIIGSGPAGYTAAVYAGRAGFNPLVLAGAAEAGGALMTTTDVDNFPGFPEGVQGPDLVMAMGEQAQRFGAEIVYDDVVEADLAGKTKTVVTASGQTHTARAVIVATGSAYKRLGVLGEDEFAGRGVSWCATCDGFFFTGKTVVVVGGGDSAAEEALFLTRFASKVYLAVRSGKMRAAKVLSDRVLADEKIEVLWDTQVVAIDGDDGGQVRRVVLEDPTGGYDLKVDGVFVAIGHAPRTDLFTGELALDRGGYVLTAPGGALGSPRRTLTNLPGVFAAGDVADPVYRQAITAAASGCQAALDAQEYLTSES